MNNVYKVGVAFSVILVGLASAVSAGEEDLEGVENAVEAAVDPDGYCDPHTAPDAGRLQVAVSVSMDTGPARAITLREACDLLDEPPNPVVDPWSVVSCVTDRIIAWPVTPVITGNGGESWFQLFQDSTGQVYGSYGLSTNDINNGADEWVFGWGFNEGPSGRTDANGAIRHRSASCEHLGFATPGFDFHINAGAGGWTSDSSCEVEFHWEIEVGIRMTAVDSGVTTTGRIGGSIACSDGTIFDSESLFDDIGSAIYIGDEFLP